MVNIDGVEQSWDSIFRKDLLKVDGCRQEFTIIDFVVVGQIYLWDDLIDLVIGRISFWAVFDSFDQFISLDVSISI